MGLVSRGFDLSLCLGIGFEGKREAQHIITGLCYRAVASPSYTSRSLARFLFCSGWHLPLTPHTIEVS